MEVLLGIVAALLTGALVLQGIVLRRRAAVIEPSTASAELASQRDELTTVLARLDDRAERLAGREERLGEFASGLQRDRERLEAERVALDASRDELANLTARANDELERLAGMSAHDARAEVVAAAQDAARRQAQQLAREITDEAVREAENSARRIVTIAIERVAVQQTSGAVITAVDLPSEEMKGRIIGREGRNIRAFEHVTGVTLLVDDSPGTVLLSCFDPVRREVARQALVELVAGGRIDPARIEEVCAAASCEVERTCVAAAQTAIDSLGLSGIDQGLLVTIGALGYRTSFGQNVLEHSIECAELAGAMAAELGLDVEVCRRAGFLHDLGKAVITHGEGSHAAEGAELARRHGQDAVVVHAIAAHHNEVTPDTAVDVLTQAADAISSSRPGARHQSAESHIRRLEQLEEIAGRQPGVGKAYAIQAGRELRVMVVPEMVDEGGTQQLAHRIAAEVEREVTYAGRIKVTVIRETRVTAVVQ